MKNVVSKVVDGSVVVEIERKMRLERAVSTIVECGTEVVTKFCEIGAQLKVIRDQELFKIAGYDDIYSFSEAMFGYRSTSTKNFIGLVERFCKIYKHGDVELKEEFEDYSLTQLVELLPVADDELTKFKPSMKVKDIRVDKKVSRLTEDVDALKKILISEIKAMKFVDRPYSLKTCVLKSDENSSNSRLFELYVEFEADIAPFKFPFAYIVRCDSDGYDDSVIEFAASHESVKGFKISNAYIYEYVSGVSSLSEFIKNFKESIDSYCNKIHEHLSKDASLKQEAEAKQAAEEDLKVPTLKNDKMREAHVRGDVNWEFVEHIDFLDIDIYKFKTSDKYFRFVKKQSEEPVIEYYEKNDYNFGLGYSVTRLSFIVNHLKEIRF